MNLSTPPFAPIWTATALSGSATGAPLPNPADIGPQWYKLGQAWREAPEAGFNKGWGRIRWDHSGLLCESVFVQKNPANRARQLNERTWEMGDIAEFFVQEAQGGRYLEIHVTPENQRLQLRWPPDGLSRFRAGTAPLEQFLIADPDWVRSDTDIGANHWSARVYIPFNCLSLAKGIPRPALRTAICRYDRTGGAEILSSTARLPEPNYHLTQAWADLELAR